MFRKQHGDFQWFPLVVQGNKVSVRLICKGKNGLLIVKSAEGMFRFDTRNHTYERLNALHEVAGNIFQMASDADGMLWVSIWYDRERGFVHYDPYQDKVLHAFGAEERGISNTDLNDIYPDGENVWMATNSSGLCRYVIREDRFYCYPANAGVPGSLWSNQLSRITKDRFGIDLSDFVGEAVAVSIFSDLGQLVWENRIPAVADLNISVSLREAGATAGMYTVRVQRNAGVISKRLLLVE